MKVLGNKTDKEVDENFVNKGIDSVSDADFDIALNKKDQLFAKINHPNWQKYKHKIILMFEFLKDVKQKNYTETPWKTLAAITFTVLYIINPLDLVPDFIPFLGYIDDITVFGFVLQLVNKDLESYEEWKLKQEKPMTNSNTQ